MMFQITHKSTETAARTGIIMASHGEVNTPVFMPVATQATVKAISTEELYAINTEIFISNTYHLYLRPGLEVIKAAGGLHKFINWDRNIITDSGGFQVFSMAPLREITENGVEFQSHIDGSKHFFTPENIIEIQLALGSDIMMCFDECAPYPCTKEYAKKAMDVTAQWAKRCKLRFLQEDNKKQFLFGIVQGSTYLGLREESASQIRELDFDGYALGGIAVGEPKELSDSIVISSTHLLPENKPRYAMGIGTPEDLWNYIEQGIDMFDCVLPTRNGRNGQALTFHGKINIRNAQYKKDFIPLDEDCQCPVCRQYTRAYIHHLFVSGELLSMRLLSLHNVFFMVKLMSLIRNSIINDSFLSVKKKFFNNYV